jgi:hypothetical protein
MAFFMWLEKKSNDMNLVQKLLFRWPEVALIDLVNESAVVLDCIEFSRFPVDFSPENHLPLIEYILRRNDLTLNFFHNHRLEVIKEVTKVINDICIRAFSDIIEQMHHGVDQRFYLGNVLGAAAARVHVPHPSMQMQPQINELGGSYAYNGQQDMNQIMANLSLDETYAAEIGFVTSTDNKKKIEMRPIDDRTIFMTFSKGYPISETEVREFFTRYVPFNHLFIYSYIHIIHSCN